MIQTSQAEEWDLKTCLEQGLKRNPSVLAALQAIEAAEARVKQNLSAYYPSLFAETDYAKYKTSTSATSSAGNLLSTSSNNPTDLTSYYLGLTQNIYDFGRREYKVQASKEDKKTYQWSLKDIRLSVIDNIRQAYYGVLLAQRVVKVRKEDLARTQEHLVQAKGFYNVGLKAMIDVTQAEVAVVNAQKTLLQAENDVLVNWVTLAAAMGLDEPPTVSLKDDLGTSPVDWKLEDLKKEALDKDPILNRLKALVTYWDAQTEGAKRNYWPTLTGTAKLGRNVGSSYNNDEMYNVGLQFNFPFFSGFQDQSRIVEYQASMTQAKANVQAQKLLVLSNLQNQFLAYVLALKQIEVTREALRSARENLTLATGRYKAGVGAMLDVTDARGSYVQAENDYNQALYNSVTTRYKVERAIGRE